LKLAVGEGIGGSDRTGGGDGGMLPRAVDGGDAVGGGDEACCCAAGFGIGTRTVKKSDDDALMVAGGATPRGDTVVSNARRTVASSSATVWDNDGASGGACCVCFGLFFEENRLPILSAMDILFCISGGGVAWAIRGATLGSACGTLEATTGLLDGGALMAAAMALRDTTVPEPLLSTVMPAVFVGSCGGVALSLLSRRTKPTIKESMSSST
jgi:hypothetical protein